MAFILPPSVEEFYPLSKSYKEDFGIYSTYSENDILF